MIKKSSVNQVFNSSSSFQFSLLNCLLHNYLISVVLKLLNSVIEIKNIFEQSESYYYYE